jgi:RimJ/RimL family protein N-acetyltransferase
MEDRKRRREPGVLHKQRKIELVIEGELVSLKEFTKDNLFDERYHQWLRDIQVVNTIGRNEYLAPLQFSKIEEYVERLLESETDYLFAIYTKNTDLFIGTLKIGSIDWYNRTADLGIMIGDKKFWKKGLAKNALQIACNYAFEHLNMRKLTGGCLAVNIAMSKCFERLGFLNEGLRRKQNFFEGRYIDHLIYGLFKEDFAPK